MKKYLEKAGFLLIIISLIFGVLLYMYLKGIHIGNNHESDIKLSESSTNLEKYQKTIYLLTLLSVVSVYSTYTAFCKYQTNFNYKKVISFIHKHKIRKKVFLILKSYQNTLLKTNPQETSNIKPKMQNKITIMKTLSIAIFFLFFYLLICRYLTLGNDFYLFGMITSAKFLNLFFTIIFLWSFLSIWIRLVLWSILDIKIHIKEFFKYHIFEMHLFLLQNKTYFKIIEKAFKFCFIIENYLIHNSIIYNKWPLSNWRNMVFYLQKKPFIIRIIIVLIIPIELLLRNGHLFYSQYLLFIYIIISPIVRAIRSFGSSKWELNCCESDYKYFNWSKPRYHVAFWSWFLLFREEYNNWPELSTEVIVLVNQKVKENKEKNFAQIKRTHNLRKKISNYQHVSLLARHKLAYRAELGIRWTHTVTIVQASNAIWHPCTVLFARNMTHFAAAINNHWSHFHKIEQMRIKVPYFQLKYNNVADSFLHNPVTIAKAIEHNFQTNFVIFQNFGIKVSEWNKEIIPDSKNQAKDDVFFDFRNSNPPIIENGRIIGVDQKASTGSSIDDPSSKVFSSVSPEKYSILLRNFKALLKHNFEFPKLKEQEIDIAITELNISCTQLNIHLEIWAKYVHLFPNDYMPPIRVPENFATHDFSNETMIDYKLACLQMEKVSKILLERNVPNDLKNAGEILDGSFIQAIMEQ